MGRMRRGWELTKKSWTLLRENPSLSKFPIYGAISMFIAAVIIVVPSFLLIEKEKEIPGIAILVIGMFVLAIIAFYFSVGLAATADKIFRGESATTSDGFAVARERFPQIAGWAALSATLGLVLSIIRDQGGILGNIAAGLVGLAWSLVTFLAAPIVAIEGTGPFATLKRSAGMFKSRWGTQITGNIAIGGIIGLVGFLPGALFAFAGYLVWSSSSVAGAALAAIGIVIIGISLVISNALNGVFGVALYHYVQDGQPIAGFTADEFESVVRQKKGSKVAPTSI